MIKLDPDILARGDQGLAHLTYTLNAMATQHRALLATGVDATTAWALAGVRIQEYYTELDDPDLTLQSLSVILAAAISMIAAAQEVPTP